MASKNSSNCFLAASSFHFRSRRMDSSNSFTASSFCPCPNNATANSSLAWWSAELLSTFAFSAARSPASPALSARARAEINDAASGLFFASSPSSLIRFCARSNCPLSSASLARLILASALSGACCKICSTALQPEHYHPLR